MILKKISYMKFLYICIFIGISHSLTFSQELDSNKSFEQQKNSITLDSLYYQKMADSLNTNPQLALKYATLALDYSRQNNNSELELKSLYAIGYINNKLYNYEIALDYLIQSKELAIKGNRSDRLVYSYYEIGNNYLENFDLDKAIENYLEVIKHANKSKNFRYEIAGYNQIGIIYLRLDKPEEALNNFQNSLEIRELKNIKDGLIVNYLNIALCYRKLAKYNNAIEFFQRVLNECDNCDIDNLSKAHLGLGNTFINLKDYEGAKTNIIKALSINPDNPTLNTDGYISLSKIYEELGILDSALFYLDLSLENATIKNDITQILTTKRLYAEIFEKQGDYRKALKLTNEANQLRDSAFSKDLSENIRDAYVNFEKYQSNEIIQGKDTVIKRNNQFLIMLGIIIFLMVVILSFTYRTMIFRRRLNEKLDEKVLDKTKELRLSNEQLINSRKELDSFLYRTSHDIRGPIATLIGLANLAKIESKDEIITSYLEKINITADRLNIIISRLTNISQINSQPLDIKSVDFYSTLNEILEELNLAKNKISFRLTGDLPIHIKTDKILLKIILSNILENSFKFHDGYENAQHVELEVQQNGSLEFIITDNGVGIDKQYAGRIFDLFFVASEKDRGSGIGLYQTLLATNKMNGNVELLNNRKPTKFKVSLPLHSN